MTSAYLPLTFSVDKDSCLDTLEAVLAIARRGGLRLARLQLIPRAAHDAVHMELLAPDPDLLTLFEARVRNLVDVYDLETMISKQEKQADSSCRVTLHM